MIKKNVKFSPNTFFKCIFFSLKSARIKSVLDRSNTHYWLPISESSALPYYKSPVTNFQVFNL